MQMKMQWDTTIFPLVQPKSRTLTTPNADKHVEQGELLFIVGEIAKWYTHSGRRFVIFLQN